MKFNQIFDIIKSANPNSDLVLGKLFPTYDEETNQFNLFVSEKHWDLDIDYMFPHLHYPKPEEYDCVLSINLYDKITGVRYVMYSDDQPVEYIPIDEELVVELEMEDDFIEKFTAIVNDEWYDPRVMVQIDITDEDFLHIAKAAHVNDMTFSEFVEHILVDAIAAESI